MALWSEHKRAFDAWRNAIARCCKENHPQFHRYGGRGITVCERWLKFENFLADMGDPLEGLTIDRVNNDKGYFPNNCRWATRIDQSANRDMSRLRKLDAEKVMQMRRLRAEGRDYRSIAALFDVDLMTCHKAVNRKTWKHVL